MSAKFKVNMTQKVLFDFLVTNAYHSASGIAGVLLGIAALVLGILKVNGGQTSVGIALFIFAAYLLVFMPLNLYFSSVKQMKLNASFKEALCYAVDEEGIACRQGKQENKVPWDHIIKARESRYSVLLYTGKRYSFILPKESMGSQTQVVVQLIKKHMRPEQIRISA